MARPRTPEGKRVTICVKVSESKAKAIEQARGKLTRSAWVEQVIDKGLAPAAPAERPAPVAAKAFRPYSKERQARGKAR